MKHVFWYAVRVAAKQQPAKKWWDIGGGDGNQPAAKQKNDSLSKLVKLLMPGLLGGLLSLKLAPKQQPPENPADIVNLTIQNTINKVGTDHTYDMHNKTWQLGGDKQIVQKGNSIVMTGPGLSAKATSKNLVVLLNKFLAS